jgi:uncharacterized membrane protein YphA (DoxX/SURF4 family)
MTFSKSRLALIVLRVLMGVMFIYAAWTKLREPWAVFALAVDAYGMLPQWGVVAVARVLPWAELALGVVLLAGIFSRLSTLASSGILLFFFVLLTYSYVKGLKVDCGCFGFGEAISPRTLLRDGALLTASLAMTVLAFKASGAGSTPRTAEAAAPLAGSGSSSRPA